MRDSVISNNIWRGNLRAVDKKCIISNSYGDLRAGHCGVFCAVLQLRKVALKIQDDVIEKEVLQLRGSGVGASRCGEGFITGCEDGYRF